MRVLRFLTRWPGPTVSDHGGGRSWWAHIHFTRINIKLTIFRKKIEETPPLRIPVGHLDLRAF